MKIYIILLFVIFASAPVLMANETRKISSPPRAKKIPVILATFDKVDMSKFANKFGYFQLDNFKDYHEMERKLGFATPSIIFEKEEEI